MHCERRLCIIFFFSSRRRHTRWPRDWSSDVCSSDLSTCTASTSPGSTPTPVSTGMCKRALLRSEERRVGKEWRSRWTPARSRKSGEELELSVCVKGRDEERLEQDERGSIDRCAVVGA